MLLLCMSFLWLYQDHNATADYRQTVEQVYLDVIVTDKKGNPITDLNVDEFMITDNRKKIKADSFEIVRHSSTGTNSSSTGDKPLQFIFALDLADASSVESSQLYSQMEASLSKLPQDVPVQLKLFDMNHGLVTPEWLNSIGELKKLIATRKVSEGIRGEQAYASAIVDEPNLTTIHKPHRSFGYMPGQSLEDLEARLEQCLSLGEGDRPNAFQVCARQEFDDFLSHQRARSEMALSKLKQFIRQNSQDSGMKTILFFTPGFALNPGQSGSYIYNQVLSQGLDGSTPVDDLSAPSVPSVEDELREVVHHALANRMVFHVFDLYDRGADLGRSSSTRFGAAPSRMAERAYRNLAAEMLEGSRFLAANTGGKLFGSANVDKPLLQLIDESPVVYVLGYKAPQGKSGKFNKIKVKVKRSGAKARHHKGYFSS